MAKDLGTKKGGNGAAVLPDKGAKGYAKGGEVKCLKAGGAAKSRAAYPMTKPVPSKKK